MNIKLRIANGIFRKSVMTWFFYLYYQWWRHESM